MAWTWIRKLFTRAGDNRRSHLSGPEQQATEHRAARERILDEARRQRGQSNGGAHRWYDGPTRLTPVIRQRAPLLTYGQRRGYRCRG